MSFKNPRFDPRYGTPHSIHIHVNGGGDAGGAAPTPDIQTAIQGLKAQLGASDVGGSGGGSGMMHMHSSGTGPGMPMPGDSNPGASSSVGTRGGVDTTSDLSALPIPARRKRHRSTYTPLVAQAVSKAPR